MTVVRYFYEGETEKKLLQHLKDEGHLLHGGLKKHNLWNTLFSKVERTINKTDHLYFFVDTDVTSDLSILIKNIKRLKPYKVRLMVQHQNFEDELCFACDKKNSRALYEDFYGIASPTEFKSKFMRESNLNGKLVDNNFDHKKLWSRKVTFDQFLISKGISINALYKIKTSPLR